MIKTGGPIDSGPLSRSKVQQKGSETVQPLRRGPRKVSHDLLSLRGFSRSAEQEPRVSNYWYRVSAPAPALVPQHPLSKKNRRACSPENGAVYLNFEGVFLSSTGSIANKSSIEQRGTRRPAQCLGKLHIQHLSIIAINF